MVNFSNGSSLGAKLSKISPNARILSSLASSFKLPSVCVRAFSSSSALNVSVVFYCQKFFP